MSKSNQDSCDLRDLEVEPLLTLPFRWEDLTLEVAHVDRADVGARFALSCGRVIELAELKQYRTYAGLLAGNPASADVKERSVRRAIEWASSTYGVENERISVLPPRLVLKNPTSLESEGAGNNLLPRVTSVALFNSPTPVNDEDAIASSAAVVWYQAGFGLPESEFVLAQLRELDWKAISWDWTW